MRDAVSAQEFARARWRILLRGTAVAAPVALLISAYFAVWQPTFGPYSWVRQLFMNVGESLAYLVVILVVGNVLLRRWLAPHQRWFLAGTPPSEEEKDALVFFPSRVAIWIFAANTVTVVAGTIGNAVTGTNGTQTLAYFLGLFVSGFTFAAIVYLLAERALRNLYAKAFAAALPQRRSVGILSRLLITWGVGSAVPLAFVAMIPLRPAAPHEFGVIVPMLYMAVAGLIVGAVTIVLVARSVAEPIDTVRAGLAEVAEGHLDTAVEVTSPGALGALQAGFNDMVDAVRSRRNLEDLFGRQVGQAVARRALEAGTELGGDLHQASVLFVDLIGSTALAERETPRAVVARLNTLFDLVVEEVGAQGGWVNKFEGDGCLCVFGAPIADEDHAGSALRAARRLRARLGATHLDAAIGVSSGEVVAGNVGSANRFEYTVIGRPVNEAARLTEAAKAESGRILASARTLDACGDEAVNWQAHGSLALKGLMAPVDTAVPV